MNPMKLSLKRFALPLAMLFACHPASAAGALDLDQLVFDSDRTGNYEIYVMRDDGSGVQRLTTDAAQDSWWGRLSPDRQRILFYRTPQGTHDTDYRLPNLWMMNADGTGQQLLRGAGTDGWAVQGHAEWSPTGTRLVMLGGTLASPQIMITDAAGGNPVAITARPGPNLDPSWAPDESQVIFIGCPAAGCAPAGQEIYTVPAGGGGPQRLTTDGLRDQDPYFSPDGGRIAWLTNTNPAAWGGLGAWGIRIMPAGGGAPVAVIDDGQINSKPQWSADGTGILFHRLMPGVMTRWNIFRVRPDGAGLLELNPGAPGNNEFPSTGQSPLPVALALTKSGTTAVTLAWSGGSAPYAIYRATSCRAVFSGGGSVQPGAGWTDFSPPAAPLLCYQVLALNP
jgi:Tol biopolymer transport system component